MRTGRADFEGAGLRNLTSAGLRARRCRNRDTPIEGTMEPPNDAEPTAAPYRVAVTNA